MSENEQAKRGKRKEIIAWEGEGGKLNMQLKRKPQGGKMQT